MHFFIEFVTWVTDPRNQICKVTQTTSYVLTRVTLVSLHCNRVCDVTGKLISIVTTETLGRRCGSMTNQANHTNLGLTQSDTRVLYIGRHIYLCFIYRSCYCVRICRVFHIMCADLETLKCRNDATVDNRSYV